VIQGGAGNDGISAATLPAGVIQLTLDGGAGNDTLIGSQGADILLGGDGNDHVIGGRGNDIADLGAGNDIFDWSPGDGSDTVEGGSGSDRLNFFGANINENISIAASGNHATLFRDVANVTMDLHGMESIELRTLAGADNITVGDLTGTDVNEVNIDLRGPNGGTDGAVDSVTVIATNGADVIGVSGDTGGVHVSGLHADIEMFFTDANDRLTVNGGGGDDVINASSLEAGAMQLIMNGGLGNDLLIGSEGDDLINGGDGNDTALMGAGNDTFVWNPGDDNDVVEGQAGSDTLQFNGANIAENITISANGGRALFTRDVANVTMDMNDVETLNFRALGGADTITVNDMSGTDVTRVGIDLGGANGGGDGQADTIIINATSGDDVVLVTGQDGRISILGLSTEIDIFNFEANDRIIINGLGGDDVIEGSSLLGGLSFIANGGDGDDVLIGGAGADTLNGGIGDDVLIGGLGLDILNGGTGSNILIQ
jgi:Ca2+-binding RTX toxin-like protein